MPFYTCLDCSSSFNSFYPVGPIYEWRLRIEIGFDRLGGNFGDGCFTKDWHQLPDSRAVAWIGGFMLFRIDKGIFRDFLKENCPPVLKRLVERIERELTGPLK